jgi:hypothetical protein
VTTEPPRSRGQSEGEAAIVVVTASIAITERWYDLLGAAPPGEPTTLEPLERIGQSIAGLSANGALPAIVTLAATGRDLAARAVQSACLAVAAARRHVRDPRALRRLALAALLVDAGRVRVSDDLDDQVPVASAGLALSSAGSPALESAALTAFEVAWLERPRLGKLYEGAIEPRLSSRLLLVVRRFLELIAPRDDAAPASPLDALRTLVAEEDADLVALGILVDAVGVLPVGTVVQLGSGEWAIVAPSVTRSAVDHPPLRYLTDEKGRAHARCPLVERPKQVRITRTLSGKETRFNLARAFFQPKES